MMDRGRFRFPPARPVMRWGCSRRATGLEAVGEPVVIPGLFGPGAAVAAADRVAAQVEAAVMGLPAREERAMARERAHRAQRLEDVTVAVVDGRERFRRVWAAVTYRPLPTELFVIRSTRG